MASSRILLGVFLLSTVHSAFSQLNVILQWNSISRTSASRANLYSPVTARALAMSHEAMFFALHNLGCHEQSSSCTPKAINVSVSVAAHRVLSSLFIADVPLFDATLLAVTSSVDQQAYVDGTDAGHRAGVDVITSRTDDGSAAIMPYQIRNTVGNWLPTPPAYVPTPENPNYGYVEPFLISDIWGLLPPGVPMFGSDEYQRDWNEVYSYGAVNSTVRTAEQSNQAYLWAEGGSWHIMTTNILAATARPDDVMTYALTFMLMSIARANAVIACYAAKYKYNSWRPVTAIRQGIPSMPSLVTDPNWTPLLTTPSFPEYVSAHSTMSAAAARILALTLGTDNASFCATVSSGARTPRCFNSIWAAAEDAGMSRIYGGIHFSFANRDGLELGKKVGDTTYDAWVQRGIPISAAADNRSVATLLVLSQVLILAKSLVFSPSLS